MTSGASPERPPPIRHAEEPATTAFDPATTAIDPPTAFLGEPTEVRTGIIRRHPTGSFPVIAEPPADEIATSMIPRVLPEVVVAPRRDGPATAAGTAVASILSGWATAVIATSLISAWWRTDELFCVAIAFLTTVSAAASIGGLISVLLRRPVGRVLVVVGAVIALMIFAGLFVAGANLPVIVYFIPVLPVASVVLALLPGTARWCRVRRYSF